VDAAIRRTSLPPVAAPLRAWRPRLGIAGLAALAISAAAAAEPAGSPPGGGGTADRAVVVKVERTDGADVVGDLEAIGRDSLRLRVADEALVMPVAEVRRIVRVHGAPRAPAAAAPSVRVVGTDGSSIAGDDFLWDGAAAVVVRGAERIEMPIDRVKTVAWSPRADVGEAARDDAPWLKAIPPDPAADLVAVARGDGFELVECAVTGVSSDSVTVVLDGERISVKRAKVLGLAWLRSTASSAAGTQVAIDGGRATATAVEWTPTHLVLDGTVRIPGGLLESIDYAAGRTVRLVALPMERVTSEPFFAGLASYDACASFFAPRAVPVPSAEAGADETPQRSLVMRPHTVAVWRVPPESRRFRATVSRAASADSAAMVEVAVAGDERSVWSRTLDAREPARQVIDVDVSSVRRLSIEIDFVAGDIGCPVRFDEAVFEK
jgi:hypothetical protein